MSFPPKSGIVAMNLRRGNGSRLATFFGKKAGLPVD
jgi:hypothetical protein